MQEAQIRPLLDEAVGRGASADQVRQLYQRLQVSQPMQAAPTQDASDESLGGIAMKMIKPALGIGLQAQGVNPNDATTAPLTDAAHGIVGGLGVTALGRGLTMLPYGPAKAVGGALSVAPMLNAMSGATGEMARGADERIGGGPIEQFLASMAGGLGPSAVSGVKSGIGSLFSRFTQAPEAIAPQAENLAAKNIADVLSRDKLDLNAIPPDQNLLQSGGKAATSRAEAIATRGNTGGDLLADYAVQQRAELPNDLSSALGGTFKEANYPALLEAIKTKAKTEAQPAYDAAYSALTKVNDDQINQALDRAVSAGDWPVLASEARKLAAYEGKKLGNIDVTGTIRSFSTQDLDYMTRALRNLGQGTEGMGAFGNKTPLGAMRANTAGSIRDRLKELNPKFAEATQNYADDIALHGAAETGKQANLFGSNWKQAVSDYADLSSNEKLAWRIGQAENLQSMIANNPGAALSRFNSPQFAKAMRTFYSPEEYDALLSNVQQAAKGNKQVQQITGNSRTATRALQQASDQADNGLSESLIRSGPKGAAKDWVVNNLVNKFSNTPVRQSADQQVAETLLSTPFNLASREASGDLPTVLRNALANRPLSLPEVARQIQLQRFLGGGKLSPAVNYLLYNNAGEQ